MILNIESLGLIKQANIDLSKKFILFCGKNSTGKTYASYVLHAFLEDGHLFSLQCMDEIIEQIRNAGSFQVKREYIVQWLEQNCKSVEDNLGAIFGISDETRDKLFPKFSLSVAYSDEDYQESINSLINVQMSDDGPSFWKITKAEGSDVVRIEGNLDISVLVSMNLKVSVMVCHILRDLAFCRMINVRMLTVERNSIYTFKTELSLSRNELIDQIQLAGKSEFDVFEMINRSSRRYPQAVRSSLRIANDLETISKNDSPFKDVAKRIEEGLLHGEVSMTKNGDVEFRDSGMGKSRKLPFHLSSSIVKTMASLVIYLRHIAKRGDTIIIDEPEMNFHPDVQVELAKIMAILTAMGLRVIISTHSDYIIREVNNLIMARAIKEKGHGNVVDDLGYSDDMLLNLKNVCVLYFRRIGKTSVVANSLPIDEEGFAVDSIDSTINNQNNRAERLYAYLTND